MFQVAVSVVLLGGASLFVQMLSVAKAGRVGFAVDGVAMLETDTRYVSASATERGNLYEELRRRVAAIPGVQSALLTRGLPMQTTGSLSLVVQDAGTAGGRIVTAGGIWAGPGYFDLLRVPLLYDRAFDEWDRRDTPRVAVVNASMARQYFGAVNAVGLRFRFDQDASSIEVIGVVPDTGTGDLSGDLVDPTRQLLYRSFAQWDVQPNTVLARTSLDAAGLVGAMQRELRAVNAALPVVSAKTMAQRLEDSLIAPKAVATLLGGLGALGLCLAGIGLYAVVAFAVVQRAHEIGIRMALGARSREVAWTVAREVVGLVGVGTAVGLTLSLLVILVIRLVTVQTPGISLYRPTADPWRCSRSQASWRWWRWPPPTSPRGARPGWIRWRPSDTTDSRSRRRFSATLFERCRPQHPRNPPLPRRSSRRRAPPLDSCSGWPLTGNCSISSRKTIDAGCIKRLPA